MVSNNSRNQLLVYNYVSIPLQTLSLRRMEVTFFSKSETAEFEKASIHKIVLQTTLFDHCHVTMLANRQPHVFMTQNGYFS